MGIFLFVCLFNFFHHLLEFCSTDLFTYLVKFINNYLLFGCYCWLELFYFLVRYFWFSFWFLCWLMLFPVVCNLSFHMLVNFPASLLFLIPSFILLWLEKILGGFQLVNLERLLYVHDMLSVWSILLCDTCETALISAIVSEISGLFGLTRCHLFIVFLKWHMALCIILKICKI